MAGTQTLMRLVVLSACVLLLPGAAEAGLLYGGG